MKTPSLIATDLNPANDFDDAVFIGPRHPHLKLVEKIEVAAPEPAPVSAPAAEEVELVTIGKFTLSPKASEQYRIQKAMQEEALAKAAREIYTQPAPPRDMTPSMMQQQQHKGGIFSKKTPIAQQPERPYPWTQMTPC